MDYDGLSGYECKDGPSVAKKVQQGITGENENGDMQWIAVRMR